MNSQTSVSDEYSLWNSPTVIDHSVIEELSLEMCAQDMGFKGTQELTTYYQGLSFHDQGQFIIDLHSQRWEPVLMYILSIDQV